MRNITTTSGSNYSAYNRCLIALKGGRAIKQDGTGYASNEVNDGLAKGISVSDFVVDTVPSVIAFGLIALVDIGANVTKGDLLMVGNNTAEGKLVPATIGKYTLAIAREDGLANTSIRADIISPVKDTSGIGVDTFIDLTDTINDYTSKGLDVLRINAGENQVESKDLSLLDLDDTTATNISYDNTVSGLTATEVQSAIDELSIEKVDLMLQPQEIYVTLLGNDTTGDGSFYKPYRTVVKAISMCGVALTVIDIGTGEFSEHKLRIDSAQNIMIRGSGLKNATTIKVNGDTVLDLTGTSIKFKAQNIKFICGSNNGSHYIVYGEASGLENDVQFYDCIFEDLTGLHCNGLFFRRTMNVTLIDCNIKILGSGIPLMLVEEAKILLIQTDTISTESSVCITEGHSELKSILSLFYVDKEVNHNWSSLLCSRDSIITLIKTDLKNTHGQVACIIDNNTIMEYDSGRMIIGNGTISIHLNAGTILKIGDINFGDNFNYNNMKQDAGSTLIRLLSPRFFDYSALPTNNVGLGAGEIFTQTAAQLGGVGATKVICVV